MKTAELKSSLSNLQLELLKLYANGISDKQLEEIKWLLGKYFAEKATEEMNKIISDKNITAEDIVRQSKAHHRSASRD